MPCQSSSSLKNKKFFTTTYTFSGGIKLPANDVITRVKYTTIAVSVVSNSKFLMYSSGVITDAEIQCELLRPDGQPAMNQAVSIVGYSLNNETPGCSGYWIVKNSWSSNWGESGYARFCIPSDRSAAGFGTCGINYFTMIPDIGQLP
jgi:cathepsin C